MSYDYFRVISTGPTKRAEDYAKTDWPINCAVCWFEHRRSVPAKSRRAALLHRRKNHPWLAEALTTFPTAPDVSR